MKVKLISIGKKQKQFFFENPKTEIPNPKICHFPAPPFTIYHREQFLQSKAYKSREIDVIGIEVAQQIELSGCLRKGYFT